MSVCEDRDQDHPDPCGCWYFRNVRNVRAANADDSYEDGGFEASKTTTGTRMATPRGSIPVTVGTFEAVGVRGGGIALGAAGSEHIYIHIHICLCIVCVYIYIYVSVISSWPS